MTYAEIADAIERDDWPLNPVAGRVQAMVVAGAWMSAVLHHPDATEIELRHIIADAIRRLESP